MKVYKYAGYCRDCNKYYEIKSGYDAELKSVLCPVHNKQVTLSHGYTLEELIKKLHLSKREIGEEQAITEE